MTIESHTFPGSSNLASASYDPDTQQMEVTFNNGRRYAANTVPRSFWDGLVNSPAPGSFYHRHLRGQFAWTET